MTKHTHKSLEIEQKYRLRHPHEVRRRLVKWGAKQVVSGREKNDLYDLGGKLRRKKSILRLRLFGKSRGLLTFKGPRSGKRFKRRMEIETEVSHHKMQLLLHELGFEVVASYSKERTEYAFGGCSVTLDYLGGIGWFIEVEGPVLKIKKMVRRLGLQQKDLEHRTYLDLLSSKK